jgi:molecular chaperone DnaJ
VSDRDYYEILRVSKTASQDELKKAYRKLAMEHHPDRNPDNAESEKKFKEATVAYDILKDEQKRAAYDRMGHNAFNNSGGGHAGGGQAGFGGGNFNDIFGDFFNDMMGQRGGRNHDGRTRGSDLKYDVTITLEEAFHGVEKKINFSALVGCNSCKASGSSDGGSTDNCQTCGGHGAVRMQQGFFVIEQTCHSCGGRGKIIKNPCVKCHGQGRYQDKKSHNVPVPAGIENGTRIRLTGEGEAGANGGSNGDLYVFVNITPHPIFKTDGADLHCRFPVNVTTAILGGEVEVPTIENTVVKLKIPSGTQAGDKFRLKNMGMSKVRSSSRGDMYVHAFVEIPKSLTKKQKELVLELQKEFDTTDNSFGSKGFLDKMKQLWGKE